VVCSRIVDVDVAYSSEDPDADFYSRAFKSKLTAEPDLFFSRLTDDVYDKAVGSIVNEIHEVNQEGEALTLSLALVLGCVGGLAAEVLVVVYFGYIKQVYGGQKPILTFYPLLRVILTLIDFASDVLFTLELNAMDEKLAFAAAIFVILPVFVNGAVIAKLFIRESEEKGRFLNLGRIRQQYDTYFPILLVAVTNAEVLEALPWNDLHEDEELPFKLPERRWIVWSNTVLEDVPQLFIELAYMAVSDNVSAYVVTSLAITVTQLLVTIFRKFLGQLLSKGLSEAPREVSKVEGGEGDSSDKFADI